MRSFAAERAATGSADLCGSIRELAPERFPPGHHGAGAHDRRTGRASLVRVGSLTGFERIRR
jgi:hypothetical protein